MVEHRDHALDFVAEGSPACSQAENVGEVYQMMLGASGYLLRSSVVCDDKKLARQFIRAAGRYGSVGELRAFNKAFPKLSEEYLLAGASSFNKDVLKVGITAACAQAVEVAKGAP